MSDGSDNPILDMGLLQMMQPNKYLNPAYAGKPLGMPGFYTGSAGDQPPTDASGKPIQSFVDYNNNAQADYQKALTAYNAQPAGGTPGTTLNSTPGQGAAGGLPSAQVAALGQWGPAINELMNNYAASQAAMTPQQQQIQATNNAYRQQQLQQQSYLTAAANQGGGFGRMPGGAFNPGQGYTPTPMGQPGAAAPAAAAGKGPPPTPPDLRQAYLDALANPGHVTTPGANVPASQPLGVPSVLSSFLAAHPGGGGKGAGAYDNSGFFNTLNKLGAA